MIPSITMRVPIANKNRKEGKKKPGITAGLETICLYLFSLYHYEW